MQTPHVLPVDHISGELYFVASDATPVEDRTMRINLTLRESALRRIDEAAREHRMSRSSYLVQRALG